MSETNQFVTKTALGAWEYQDETFEVKHTDVDYKVNLSTKFCKTQLTPLLQGDHDHGRGAAQDVWGGGSPFQWHTYSYSPLLAYLLLPNVTWSPNLGKLLFVLCDVSGGTGEHGVCL